MSSGSDYLGRDHFDALVIGSGFGGAVAACRLAQAGVDVAIVERGRRWRPDSFPRDLSRLDDGWLWLCNHGLYDVKPLNDILAIQAAGYGGGSLVYANVAMRPPQEVFDRWWPTSYSRTALDPYYDLVSYMLDVRPVSPDPRTGRMPPKTGFMARTADRLGAADAFFHPNLASRGRSAERLAWYSADVRDCLCGDAGGGRYAPTTTNDDRGIGDRPGPDPRRVRLVGRLWRFRLSHWRNGGVVACSGSLGGIGVYRRRRPADQHR